MVLKQWKSVVTILLCQSNKHFQSSQSDTSSPRILAPPHFPSLLRQIIGAFLPRTVGFISDLRLLRTSVWPGQAHLSPSS